MARPTPSTSSLAPPKLARPRAEAAELLEERIQLGRELLNRPIQTADDLATYGADGRKWMEYNYELLKTLFTSEVLAIEYRSAIPQFVITRDERLNFRNSKTKTTYQITKLESILERLGLYAEPTR